MKQLNAEFIMKTNRDDFPNLNLPEFAFIGRSNVGKSSLLNSIVLRKNLALTSSTPGKTKHINFFLVDNKWVFADLPGFGYAKVSKEYRAKWKELNLGYLEKRTNLKLTFLLIDSRHDPQTYDLALIEFLENSQNKYVIILTKTDKINKKITLERKLQIEHLVSQCKYCLEVLPYSTIDFTGRNELIGIIKKNS